MIQTIQSERVNYCRPSVDVMFSGYADLFHERELVSIILTGIGSDGAKGAAKIIKK